MIPNNGKAAPAAGQAETAPASRRHAAGVKAADAHRKLLGERRFPRKRVEQFLLAIAGDAGNAHDFAGPHFEAQVLEVGAKRIVGRVRQPRELEPDVATRRRRAVLAHGQVLADHHARHRLGRFLRGDAVAGHLARALGERGG